MPHPSPTARWLILAVALSSLPGCKNDCVSMCQQMAGWVDACGLDWESAFPDRDWESVEDCYDAHWDADADLEASCDTRSKEWESKECY